MQFTQLRSIRRSSSVLVLAALAVLVGSGPALAQAAPLIDRDPRSPTGSTATSSGGFGEGWLEVGLTLVVVLAVISVGVAVLSRLSHRPPSHA